MEGLEKKIAEFVSSILNLFKTTLLFLVPWVLVRKLRRQESTITEPYTLMGILTFFGIKFWIFTSILISAAFMGGCNGTLITQTEPKEPKIMNFLGLPSIQDLILTSLPHIIVVVLTARFYTVVFKKLSIEFDIEPHKIILYFLSFLSIMLPALIILTLQTESNWWIAATLLFFPYLFTLLKLSLTSPSKSRFKTNITLLLSSLIIPLLGTGSISLGLIFNSKFPSKEIEGQWEYQKYVSQDMFETYIVSQHQQNDSLQMKLLIKSNEPDGNPFFILPNAAHQIVNSDTLEIGQVTNVTGDLSVSTEKTALITLDCILAGKNDIYENYILFRVLNETTWEEKTIGIKIRETYYMWDDY